MSNIPEEIRVLQEEINNLYYEMDEFETEDMDQYEQDKESFFCIIANLKNSITRKEKELLTQRRN